MNKFWKKIVLAGMAGAVALGTSGCGTSLDKDAVVATMDGETEVKLGEAMFWLRYGQISTQSMLEMLMGTSSNVWNTDLFGTGEGYGETFKDNIMSDIKEMLILEKHASDYDCELTAEEEEAINTATQEFLAANNEDTLEAMYADDETVYRILSLNKIREKMTTAIEADVDTEVSDEEAAQKEISYVLFSTAGTETDDDGNTIDLTDEEKEAIKQQAQDVIDAVNGGDTFEDALAAVDEDKSVSTANYGENDENSVLDEALTTAADTLSDGEIYAEPVETDNGYYVVQMVSTFDEEATEQEKKDIVENRKSDLYDETLEGWEPDSFEINEKLWDTVAFDDSFTYLTEATTEAGTEATTETATETSTETTSGTETASETVTEETSEAETVSEAETAAAESETETAAESES